LAIPLLSFPTALPVTAVGMNCESWCQCENTDSNPYPVKHAGVLLPASSSSVQLPAFQLHGPLQSRIDTDDQTLPSCLSDSLSSPWCGTSSMAERTSEDHPMVERDYRPAPPMDMDHVIFDFNITFKLDHISLVSLRFAWPELHSTHPPSHFLPTSTRP
jgi:hypothetical protein